MQVNINGSEKWDTLKIPAKFFYNAMVVDEFKKFCKHRGLKEENTVFDIIHITNTNSFENNCDSVIVTFTYRELGFNK